MTDTLEEQCTEEELAARARRKARRNTKRFREIAAIIEARPEMHNQMTWRNGKITNKVIKTDEGVINTMCGTQQCVAGWAVALDDNYVMHREQPPETDHPWRGWNLEGASILGLSGPEARTLFHTYDDPPMGWPRTLRAIGEGVDVTQALTTEVPNCGCETD